MIGMLLPVIRLMIGSLLIFTRETPKTNNGLGLYLFDLQSREKWQNIVGPSANHKKSWGRERQTGFASTMNNLKTVIAIDQGTTSSRAILFDETGKILAQQ